MAVVVVVVVVGVAGRDGPSRTRRTIAAPPDRGDHVDLATGPGVSDQSDHDHDHGHDHQHLAGGLPLDVPREEYRIEFPLIMAGNL